MNLLGKVLLYNLSLVPLYFLFIIKKINLDLIDSFTSEYCNLEFYKLIVKSNIISLILFFLIAISLYSFYKFIKETKSGQGLPQKFTEISNIDFNHLTFIATYILPLLAFTLDSIRDWIFIIFLLTFIGIIYIKTNLYHLSPVFILFDIKVYNAKNESGEAVVLLSNKQKLNISEKLNYTKIGEIYFIKDKK